MEVQPKKPKRMESKDLINEIEHAEDRCSHWVVRKKRHCKMTVAKGKHYCGEHEPATAASSEAEADRIPCPLDSKHTVYKKNLQKHLKICNARPKNDEPAYIEKDINGGDIENPLPADLSDIKLNELKDKEFYEVVDKVKRLYAKYVADTIETLQVQHNSLDGELAKPDYGKETRKHLIQTAALLGVLDAEQQLQDSSSFVEFGAGKGQLAFHLAAILQKHENSQVILVDRMSLRHKKDNKIEDRSLVQRIRADIADLRLEHLTLLQNTKRHVAISKHLCGAATDLTLRCVTRANAQALSTEFIMIALCCHHRCEWRSFVGKEFCLRHEITPRQFVIITKMVGWAICGTGMSRARRHALEEQAFSPEEITDTQSAQRLPLAERERIGFMCKRVLDHARLEYLRAHSYAATLKYFVARDVTLENVCLLARKVHAQPLDERS